MTRDHWILAGAVSGAFSGLSFHDLPVLFL